MRVCNFSGCADDTASWSTAPPLPKVEIVDPPPAVNAPAGPTSLKFTTSGGAAETVTCTFGHSPADVISTGPCTSPAVYDTADGQSYYFKVRVCNVSGCTDTSASWSTAPPACEQPVLLSADPTVVIAGDSIDVGVKAFLPGAGVYLGSVVLPIQAQSLDSRGDGTVTVSVPASATSGDLVLRCNSFTSAKHIPIRVDASRMKPVAQAVVTHLRHNRWRLDGSVSYDPNPNGHVVAYRWTEHGRALSRHASFARTFSPGRHRLQLRVTDNYGLTDTKTVYVTVRVVRLSIPSIRFCFDCASLSSQARHVIRHARPYARGAQKVVMAGNTDSIGTRRYNYRLGLARAWNVHHALLHGLHPKPRATRTLSYGETHPVATNRTPTGRARNRRAKRHHLPTPLTSDDHSRRELHVGGNSTRSSRDPTSSFARSIRDPVIAGRAPPDS